MGFAPTQAHIDEMKAAAQTLATVSGLLKTAYAEKIAADKTLIEATAAAGHASFQLRLVSVYSVISSEQADISNLQAEIFGDSIQTLDTVDFQSHVAYPALIDLQIENANLATARADRLTALLFDKTAADAALATAITNQADKDDAWHTATNLFGVRTGNLLTAMENIHADATTP